jgi:hypothetical protein
MVSKRRAVLTLVALAVLVGGIGAQGPPVQAQERPGPMPRPDLALTADDLPPGYREVAPIDVTFGGVPIQDRSLRPTVPGLAPTWIWTATFQVSMPVTEERIARWADDLVIALSLDFGPSLDRSVGAPVVFSDWADPDPIGLGEYARLYRFRYQRLEDNGAGNGALVVFSRGDVVSVLAALGTAGRADVDLVPLARVVDERVAQEVALARR